MVKKQVEDQSGHCRHARQHQACRAQWETPSAIVTCSCACHQKAVVVKRKVVQKSAQKKVVKKSLHPRDQ